MLIFPVPLYMHFLLIFLIICEIAVLIFELTKQSYIKKLFSRGKYSLAEQVYNGKKTYCVTIDDWIDIEV